MKHTNGNITKARVTAVRRRREQADERVGGRCDIVGSMIGVKQRGDQSLGRLCLTYLVREKIPKDELAPKMRIPASVTIDGQRIETDVIAWPKMGLQSLGTGNFIRDGLGQGTLTAFAVSRHGIWGLSCGHCLLGSDKSPNTPAQIFMFDGRAGRFVPAGQTGLILSLPGGQPVDGSRGFIDCGLFDLREPSLLARAQRAPLLQMADMSNSLKGQTLVANSVLTNSPNPLRTGQVIGIDQRGIDDHSDVVLRVAAPGTFIGDSGMLWYTRDGRAAAIHTKGEIKKNTGSLLTTAMSAKRAAGLLNVALKRA